MFFYTTNLNVAQHRRNEMTKLTPLCLTAILALACALTSAAAAPKTASVSATALADAEWDFLKTAVLDKKEDVLELVLQQLEDWLARNPEHFKAEEAQFLKADLHFKLGDYKFALVDLLKYFQVSPQGASLEDAKKLFIEIVVTKADK